MGRKGQGTPILGDILAVLMFFAQVILDHPFLSIIAFTGAFSGIQAIFNGSVLDVFRFTAYNLFALFDFFLTDLQSVCLSIVNYCLPNVFVGIINLIKSIAIIGVIVKEALPLWLNMWQTSAQVSQTGKR